MYCPSKLIKTFQNRVEFDELPVFRFPNTIKWTIIDIRMDFNSVNRNVLSFSPNLIIKLGSYKENH